MEGIRFLCAFYFLLKAFQRGTYACINFPGRFGMRDARRNKSESDCDTNNQYNDFHDARF